MNTEEVKAIIDLLDDPDENIYHHIRGKLISMGNPVVPYLENAWEYRPLGNLFQERCEEIIHIIQFEQVYNSLENWTASGSLDLLDGLIILNKYQYPDLNEAEILDFIDKIEKDVWLEVNNNLTALEKIKIINYIIFNVYGFSGNIKNYHSPQNSFINNVIESKKGNPISLAAIYLIISQRLNFSVYGVNLPKHFILAYVDDLFTVDDIPLVDKKIMFYINPFSKGAIFSEKDVTDFLGQLNISPNQEFYKPCTNNTIMKRMVNNLIYSYQKMGYTEKVEETQQLYKALDIKKLG